MLHDLGGYSCMKEISVDATIEELQAFLEEINKEMSNLENEEPADENSKEYDAWAEKCEELAMKSEMCMSMIDMKTSEGLKGKYL